MTEELRAIVSGLVIMPMYFKQTDQAHYYYSFIKSWLMAWNKVKSDIQPFLITDRITFITYGYEQNACQFFMAINGQFFG